MSDNNKKISEQWVPPVSKTDRNYPYNCWWVAGLSSEIEHKLLGRWLLDTPVLLYRTEDGQAVAIEDRCPHRSAPLSKGCLKGDNVQCGYHGFTFSPDGKCVSIPSKEKPPRAAKVRAFPVIEQAPFVWVYVGDPNFIDDVPKPLHLDWYSDPAFASTQGVMDVAANYMLLKENVLDLTHFGYVHAKSFKITDWIDPPTCTTEGDQTSFLQTFKDSPLPGIFATPLGLEPGTPYDRDNYGSFVSPALQIAAVDLIEPKSKTITGRFRVTHAATPIDNENMYYFWVVGRDFGTSEKEIENLKVITEVGFKEDEDIIEAVQRVKSRDPKNKKIKEVSVKTDMAGVQARRIIERWMEKETVE